MDLTLPGGLLIVVEGIDGAGKTTLANRLRDTWQARGIPVVASKEPTRGQWGMKLRASAESGRLSAQQEVEYLLHDRREHVDTLIRPALLRGEVVILDRYYPSMIAYQGAAGVAVDQLMRDNGFAPVPDALILLDIDPAEGIRRIIARGDRPNAFETLETLEACRRIFLDIDVPMATIDARKSEDEVFAEAMLYILGVVATKARANREAAEACRVVEHYMPKLAAV